MKKVLTIALAILGVAILFITFAKIFSSEDTWIKDSQGNWIKHGSPAASFPPLQ